ncbi:tripartite tricarboxylate transporter TctB family protein [Breoghania sp. L-A4]|uniref:tripartite tricarboxylate transporter TctB family protein n=1 Tax=Breoghania sp. L-A4 TaxID=2304600 RepID=UPI000E36057B|nr:tripartite tricarboxylate transporter TctB family protein [Breoghania sp. L-A4]AXS41515.1 tripartite tricarboxylate transporter [Breoghania sp. L-A4]
MGDFTKVTIDFETSHLLFPIIIACILVALGAAIVLREQVRIAGAAPYWGRIFADMDKARFFGTIGLTLAYFSLMVPVGDVWPNTGLGFLLCSVPFVFLTGVLFLHERSVRELASIAAVALIVPSFVWWLFTEIFFLTLP